MCRDVGHLARRFKGATGRADVIKLTGLLWGAEPSDAGAACKQNFLREARIDPATESRREARRRRSRVTGPHRAVRREPKGAARSDSLDRMKAWALLSIGGAMWTAFPAIVIIGAASGCFGDDPSEGTGPTCEEACAKCPAQDICGDCAGFATRFRNEF